MAMAYTPGLKRKASTVVAKIRKLPIKGKVLVKEGERISYDTEVASTNLPGKVNVLNLALILELESTSGEFEEERKSLGLSKYLLKNVGDTCEAGEVIALRKTFFGLYQRECKVSVTGSIEYVSDVTGQCMIREPAIPLALDAYIPGTVTKVIPDEGVEIETQAALIQGIFGIGEETHGELMMVNDSEKDALTEDLLTEECAGKIVVGGSIVDGPTLKKAVELGVKGIIVGGIKDADLTSFLGYSIGVAITGEERMGLTLILTEGFGKMSMAVKTFNFLKEFEGKLACINGATQIRAGVIRPEIIIPIDESSRDGREDEELHLEGLTSGLPVRIIGPPYFGAIGHVIDLPVDLQTVETESKVRVLEVELEDGCRVTVPRANVELIEE
ncbi:MAG: hypothetical protein NWE88_08135 [Candidatus Bathyarchaeota archaeon]|nr:hypothetical protein [Candidatus Bathyarchaeota archaeon]